ncbi:hypothetical protein KJ713_02950 [Patescibacteria group bacterium]|nr:hypothetical protein [Patescibacteria group bacterium]
MELWQAVKAIPPGWWLVAFCLALAPLVLGMIIPRLLVSLAAYFLYCPVCDTRILNRASALRTLAVAHRVSPDIPPRQMRRKLVELAEADIHHGYVAVVYHHRDGDGRKCVCLITICASGQLGVANYAPREASQEAR